ncbi:MAG: S-layer homology domain-containing protein [Candidatus Margulisbacteria bacterium]|nr:S-layer homology domain-containing protein [Candidatus Margulisiibacteriota bacterium]MBU1022475.1 S-layer homology domain-containing protein [Candidatus Margulisiibacteriota bacterium]MBU1728459.1 S-layer homology domain-containing protein [Candidatus Margulisiibacteriota bacterium]MBU1954606.1 S-layer homology domain-containing protein [Candidatus Margulisiibacteriota bacterium]
MRKRHYRLETGDQRPGTWGQTPQKSLVSSLLSLVLLSLLVFSSPVSALLVENKVAAFDAEAGARPLGMSGAFVAQADDVCSAMYNPAGLTWSKGIALNIPLGSRVDFSNVSAFQAYPSGYGYTLGLGLANKKVSKTNLNYNSNILIGSIGGKLSILPFIAKNNFTENLALGMNLKTILGQTVEITGSPDQSSNGWEADFGGLFRYNRWINLGFNLKNAIPSGLFGGGRFTWTGGTSEAIPATAVIGASVKLVGDVNTPFYVRGNEVFLNLDYERGFGDSQVNFFKWGIEWAHWNSLFLRVGGQGDDSRDGAKNTIGVGIRREGWGADVALASPSFSGGQTMVFSFMYFPQEWKFVEQEKAPLDEKIRLTLWTSMDDLSTYDETIIISGEVQAGVRAYVNNQEAFVNNRGQFSVELPLFKGKNLIGIKGEYFGEEIMSGTKRVLRKAKVIISGEKKIDENVKLVKTEEEKIMARKAKVEETLKDTSISAGLRNQLNAEIKALEKREATVVEEKEKLVEEKKQMDDRKEKVEALVTLGVVEVEEDQEFEIEAAVTRGELASWLVKSAGLPLPRVERELYTDVPADHPLAPYIKVLAELGIMEGFGDGTFRPDAPVTEEEGKAIFRKFGVIR